MYSVERLGTMARKGVSWSLLIVADWITSREQFFFCFLNLLFVFCWLISVDVDNLDDPLKTFWICSSCSWLLAAGWCSGNYFIIMLIVFSFIYWINSWFVRKKTRFWKTLSDIWEAAVFTFFSSTFLFKTLNILKIGF